MWYNCAAVSPCVLQKDLQGLSENALFPLHPPQDPPVSVPSQATAFYTCATFFRGVAQFEHYVAQHGMEVPYGVITQLVRTGFDWCLSKSEWGLAGAVGVSACKGLLLGGATVVADGQHRLFDGAALLAAGEGTACAIYSHTTHSTISPCCCSMGRMRRCWCSGKSLGGG